MNDNTDEIDLIELSKRIFKQKFFILKFTLTSALIGIIYSLSLTNIYTSSTTFIPQINSSSSSNSSSLGGLASIAGIDIGGMKSSSEFPPSLYPQIIESIPFKLDLLSSTIVFEENNITIKDYFLKNNSSDFFGILKKYTFGLPSLIMGSVSKDDNKNNYDSFFYLVSDEDNSIFNSLSGSLNLVINEKEGFITISYVDKDKFVAAQIAKIAKNLLQKKIIEFKNKSSKELLDYTFKLYKEKKISFEKLQDERAVFVDKNINISSSLYLNKLNRIETELNISQAIVQQLSSQVEQAKLQVNRDTPVFTTIEPVNIPFSKSDPKRTFIVLKYLLIGLVISSGYVLIKNPVSNIFKLIKS